MKDKILVDREDEILLTIFAWWNCNGYARTILSDGTTEYLHRMIMKARPGETIDHINRNKLDNRKFNLRLCTQSQNMGNQEARKKSSKYKGVMWEKSRKKYKAQLTVNGKATFLGRFVCEWEAAKAYNRAAQKIWGEYALLNVKK